MTNQDPIRKVQDQTRIGRSIKVPTYTNRSSKGDNPKVGKRTILGRFPSLLLRSGKVLYQRRKRKRYATTKRLMFCCGRVFRVTFGGKG